MQAEIPEPVLRDALDDDGDGQADAGLLDQIIVNASDEINGLIGGRYTTPLVTPPSVVKRAALVFSCEAVYRRRRNGDDQNPYRKTADALRQVLKDIGAGKLSLDAAIVSDVTAAFGSATFLPSRVGEVET